MLGPLPAENREKDDGGQILHDEDADRDSPVQRRRLPPVFQDLHDEDGAGKAQCERDEERA